jgi:hypothetical protein
MDTPRRARERELSAGPWKRYTATLPTRQLDSPWPFPLSVVDGRTVLNLPPLVQPKAKPAKKRRRGQRIYAWCRGWNGNAERVAAGLRPTSHSWEYVEGEGDWKADRCLICQRTRAELLAMADADNEAERTAPKQRGRPVGAIVKLTCVDAELPPKGAVLELATGRRYRVLSDPGTGYKTMHCKVLDPSKKLPPNTLVLPWRWVKREKAAAA